MANHSRSNSHDLGFGNLCKACKSIVSNCYTSKNSSFSKKIENKTKPGSIQEHIKNPDKEKTNEKNHSRQLKGGSRIGSFKTRTLEDYMKESPYSGPQISRSMSTARVSKKPSHIGLSGPLRSTSVSQTAVPPTKSSILNRRNSLDSSYATRRGPLSKTASRRGSNVIMYSNSHGLVKPPPMEKELECSLEELCFGCIKKVSITRDAVMENGQIMEKEEVLTIKVNPGWRRRTQITFEGIGNEIPGTDPGDVIFVVSELQHHMFRREGDDLYLGFDIPLVDALTNSTLSIPLLGGHAMSLACDEIIYPGYQKIVTGQGMPKHDEPRMRGNLIITFSVEYQLTEEQRSEVVEILKRDF